MARLRFGPAGKPYDMKSGDYVRAIEIISEIGLDAIEYEAVRGIAIKRENAEAIKRKAQEKNVVVSMHAPYFLNFASPKDDTVQKSVERLIKAAEAAGWMNAYVVVFHPGYYKGHDSREDALQRTITSLLRVADYIKQSSIGGVFLSPETTGKDSQVGSLDEVIAICREVSPCKPTIDWAHLYARSEGSFITSVDDVIGVIERLEAELGREAVNPLHTHFSKIEYGRGGEREHHTLAETEYGPEWSIVCKGLKEVGVNAIVISESPILDKDAIVMKKICERDC